MIDDEQRRARLARRHALLTPAADAVAATRAVAVLHATEPATVHLSIRARVPDITRAQIDATLYDDRTLVRQLAMRRTLFCFPRDLLPAAWGSSALRVHAATSQRLVKDAELAGAADGRSWLAHVRSRVLEEITAAPEGLTAVEVRARVPEIDLLGPGRHRVLTDLGLSAQTMRGRNTQHWRIFRPRWTLTERWLGEPPVPTGEGEGFRILVRRWLERFSPGTEDDLVWWLGATKGIVRSALAELGAVGVETAAGRAWVLPDDPLLDSRAGSGCEPGGAASDQWAALLPVLDPTVMGWRHRDWYLGPHAPALFDRNGNAGTTAWWNGRVVGCWTQDAHGVVEVRPLEALPAAARRALAVEAGRLTDWLAGERVGTVYPSPAMRVEPADLPYPVLRA